MGQSREREATAHLSRALAEVGLEAASETADAHRRADLVIRGRHDVELGIEVQHRALIREGDVAALKRGVKTGEGTVNVVVADRITRDAKERLREDGWGWLDLRGDLHIEAPGIFIAARVDSAARATPAVKEPLTGAVGLELASLLLMRPSHQYGVREAAAELKRAPSAISAELARMRASGLVGESNRPVSPDLFWALSRRWRPESIDIASVPMSGRSPINDALQLGMEDREHQAGWALGGTLAAIEFGAPLSATAAYPPDLYLPDRDTLRRAAHLLGVAPLHAQRAATIRPAPVPQVTAQRVTLPEAETDRWPLVHPLFVALDLAQDAARGAEALSAWEPPEGWERVW